HVVSKRQFRRTGRAGRNAAVPRNAGAWPDRQLQSRLKIKESHSAIFELCPDNSVRLQSETFAIEPQCAFQVIDAEGDYCDTRFQWTNGAPTVPAGARLGSIE